MSFKWEYDLPEESDQLAPYIPVIIKNPLRGKQIEVKALVDTGYDGFLVLGIDDFLALGLDEYEIPVNRRAHAEIYGGNKLNIRTASGEVIIPDLDLSLINDIDAVGEDIREVLVGRRFLEYFTTLLRGLDRTITLSSHPEKR